MSALDRLSGKKLLAVCLPLYDGRVSRQTWFALREEEMLLAEIGLPWRFDIVTQEGCSLIAHARNELTAAALKRNADALLWIDGDMGWETGAVVSMLLHDVDVIAAAVPRKRRALEWNVRFLSNPAPHPRGLLEVETVGTGLMLTKRRVFDVLAERLNNHHYQSAHGQAVTFFESVGAVGEDVTFCHRWRDAGGQVWVDPKINMEHVIAPDWSVSARLSDWLATKQMEQAA